MRVLTRTRKLIEMTKARTGRDGWRDGKGQIGIDGNRDVDFTKRNRSPAWNVQSVHSEKPNYPGAYANNESGLRDTGTDPESYAKIDIFDLAESQSDRTGPVVLRKRDR